MFEFKNPSGQQPEGFPSYLCPLDDMLNPEGASEGVVVEPEAKDDFLESRICRSPEETRKRADKSSRDTRRSIKRLSNASLWSLWLQITSTLIRHRIRGSLRVRTW